MAEIKDGTKILQFFGYFEMPEDFDGSTLDALKLMVEFYEEKDIGKNPECDMDTTHRDFVTRLFNDYIETDHKITISSNVVQFNEKEIVWNPLTSAFDDVPRK